MKQEIEKALYDTYAKENLQLLVDEMVFGTKFYKEGINYYGSSRYFSEKNLHELLSIVHPRHLEQTIHFVFIPHRRAFLKELVSSDSCCRKDLASFFKKNAYSCFESETDTFIYLYEFNLEKKWEQTMIIATILAFLYEKNHPEMSEQKRKKKREIYVHRMMLRIKEKQKHQGNP